MGDSGEARKGAFVDDTATTGSIPQFFGGRMKRGIGMEDFLGGRINTGTGMEDLLGTLTEPQRAAATHVAGPST